MDADTDKLMRSVLTQAKTSKDLASFVIMLEGIAGEENVALVEKHLAKLEKAKGKNTQ